jgi:hypothetical protein
MTEESKRGVQTISEFLQLNSIDRRKFLIGMESFLVGLSGLSLIGCGAGSTDNSAPPPPPPPGSTGGPGSGRVLFPTGFAANLKGLTVASGYGSSSVDGSMGFAAATDPSSPSLVYVQDSTGAVIFLGFVDPTSDSNVLGALSTAISLVYFALDAYSLPPANNAAILALIAADPTTTTLANAISQRMLARTYALDQSDATITAALAAAYNGITGATAGSRQPPSVGTPALAMSPAELAISGGLQSGFNINVDPTGNTTSYTGQNTFRRYATMYAYQTSITDATGTVSTLPSALLVGTPVDVDSTQRLNFFTALRAIFTTTTPLSPVTSSPVTLALPSGATGATFDIIVLGSSASGVEPAFFGRTAYAGEVAGWRSKVTALNLRTALGDIFFGMVLNMLGVGSISVLAAGIDAATASLVTIGDAAWQAAIQEAAAGTSLTSPINYAANLILKGASVPSTKAYLQAIFQAYDVLIQGANAAKAAAISEASFTTSVANGLRVIGGALSGASIVLGVGDLAAVIHDMKNAHQGDVWSAVLGALPFHVNPASVSVIPGSSTPQQFTVSLPPGTTGSFEWTWTLTGGVTAQITDEVGHQGTSLSQISSMSVFLLTTPNDVHPMTLTVEGFFVGTGGVLDSIGTAVASIAVTANATFAVRTWTGSVNENDFSDPTHSSQFATVVGFFTFPSTPGATNYKIELPHDNVANLSASDVAGLPVATDRLGFPPFPQGQGSGAPWGGFVQLGNGLLGWVFNYAEFPTPNSLYVSPDGISVTAAQQDHVFWRYYTIEGQSSLVDGRLVVPISATVIADTLVYMQTIMLNEMTSVGPPILTVT